MKNHYKGNQSSTWLYTLYNRNDNPLSRETPTKSDQQKIEGEYSSNFQLRRSVLNLSKLYLPRREQYSHSTNRSSN